MPAILISAKRGHGKDTVCDMMIKKLAEKGKLAKRFAMADQLKVFCDNVYQDMKQYMTKQYQHIDNSLKQDAQGMRFRRKWWLSVGKHVKKSFGHLIWVDTVFNKPFVADSLYDDEKFSIITDMRFMNQYEYSRTRLGHRRIKLMRVWRPGDHPVAGFLGTSQSLVNDRSETDLDLVQDYQWDFFINNDSDLKSLQIQVDKVVNLLTT